LNWSHILGLDRVIKEILDVVVPPLKRPELLQGSLKVPRSVLLFGPPGCGKSLLLKVLASQIDIPVFSVSAATLFSKWQGESQKMIHALYTVAWEEAPSIVFIDEFDGLFSSPVQQQSNVTTTSLAIQLQKELQQYMDGLKTPEINQTVTIGATNFPWHIQPSLLRRFDRILYIHPPAPNIILKLLEYLLSGIDHEITRKELYQLSEKFSGYTPDEIKKICETARLRSFTHLRKSRTGFSYLIKSPRALQFEDILASFSVLRPLILKLSSKPGVSTKEFRKWNKMFGIPDIIYPLQAWEYSGSVEQDLMERQYETPRGRN
jgi:vacuolar protein-sorting-associated protein 4